MGIAWVCFWLTRTPPKVRKSCSTNEHRPGAPRILALLNRPNSSTVVVPLARENLRFYEGLMAALRAHYEVAALKQQTQRGNHGGNLAKRIISLTREGADRSARGQEHFRGVYRMDSGAGPKNGSSKLKTLMRKASGALQERYESHVKSGKKKTLPKSCTSPPSFEPTPRGDPEGIFKYARWNNSSRMRYLATCYAP